MSPLRAETYFAVERNPRFQAVLRRQVFDAVRPAMLITVGVLILGGLVSSLIHTDDAPLILAVYATLAVVVLGVAAVAGRVGRRFAEPIVFAVATLGLGACCVLGIFGSGLDVLATGYLIGYPLIVALVVPWRTWVHMLWLLVYAVILLTIALVGTAETISPLERLDIAFLMVLAASVSFGGHVLGHRLRIRGFQQLTNIHSLRHAALRQSRVLAAAQVALQEAARIDHLTGAGNRVRLYEDLVGVRGRIQRVGERCGLLELDIDHFKAINDRSGHLAGDATLRAVIEAFQGSLRAGEFVYRWGGDEFVIVLPGADVAGTRSAAERLAAAVRTLAISNPDNAPSRIVTVSIGGTVVDRRSINETFEQWLAKADQALYIAKAEGRDRVAVH